MVIVDSTVWIDYLELHENEYSLWLEQRIGQEAVGLTDMILMEVLQGVRKDAHFRQIRDRLTQSFVFDTGGQELAIAAAENYRYLRARGHTIRKSIDCITATFCINKGHSLLHRDRDFNPFGQYLGLKVIHPTRH